MIEYGDADVMIAGGAESTVSPLGIGGFAAARALSTRNDDPATASRPWDKDRDGFVLGEGAGVLVLEEYEHAKRRGAKIYAELVGFGMGADAFHMTAPNVDGPKRSMKAALRNAGINADQVQYLNAHGTSTPLGDVNETNAIKLAFGDHAKKLVVNSTKSMTGHLLGGAGGIESVFTVLAVHHQISPPTINIFNQDPECDLDYCANAAREMKIDVRGQEQLRLRRHQRHAGLQARLTPPGAADARLTSLRDHRRADSAPGALRWQPSRSRRWQRSAPGSSASPLGEGAWIRAGVAASALATVALAASLWRQPAVRLALGRRSPGRSAPAAALRRSCRAGWRSRSTWARSCCCASTGRPLGAGGRPLDPGRPRPAWSTSGMRLRCAVYSPQPAACARPRRNRANPER